MQALCKHCGKGGHTIENSRTKTQDMGAAARLAASSGTEFNASQSLSITASSSTFPHLRLPLILDSGATDHIFFSADYFYEY